MLGLQVPHGDSVGIPEEAQLHFVQNLGQELLWQLTIPHQVISFLIGAEVKLEQEPDPEKWGQQSRSQQQL